MQKLLKELKNESIFYFNNIWYIKKENSKTNFKCDWVNYEYKEIIKCYDIAKGVYIDLDSLTIVDTPLKEK